ncbi:3-deoxy-7-phosphoheptulonate synthase [Stratiformator vulcanicus]|uniref:Phospho-2-dehydro-3-deoxyheptonate aldolase n=1 Tax=Stratiformator vulcanicus TaxID=2527980 RepID=A0A517R5A0_9PLAN|nr:3-deoxy-7-phosphoheptulonate synthase [Stratiformator vulcanicus]QDT39019.1 Phospho-2-dehydro-3-deoxyheptonate aldolase, Tyr-sensitive [Stratiformator vulcanicus]
MDGSDRSLKPASGRSRLNGESSNGLGGRSFPPPGWIGTLPDADLSSDPPDVMKSTADLHIRGYEPLIAPHDLLSEVPATEDVLQTTTAGREAVRQILAGEDSRLLVVVGPCSIHNRDLALEYARRLKGLSDKVAERMLVVMRVYFEKPRTTVGWKGLINDPHLNDTFAVSEGLKLARGILTEINKLGLPAATEMLEPITPQYIADLITLASIGARTTESPTHRQMASGLSMPVGYKNGTDGSVQTALNAMLAAKEPHSFLGIDPHGKTCVIHTNGNPWGHLILRGGNGGPNYSPEHVAEATRLLTKADLPARFLIDCSHANSSKDYRRQPEVFESVLSQRIDGADGVIGMMLESNLNEGKQSLGGGPEGLDYGVSITDGCLGWEQTEELLLKAAERLEPVEA